MARGASAGKPTKLKIIFGDAGRVGAGADRRRHGIRAPRGVTELGITTFAFILIANWLAALPPEHVAPPPTADVNLVYPMARPGDHLGERGGHPGAVASRAYFGTSPTPTRSSRPSRS